MARRYAFCLCAFVNQINRMMVLFSVATNQKIKAKAQNALIIFFPSYQPLFFLINEFAR
jgi:hypothetical protein